MPKIVDHDQRRSMLAETTAALICKQGISGATVREVARACGVSTGTVSHYFRDSSELLFAAYQVSFRDSSERFVTSLRDDNSFAGLTAAVTAALPLDDARRCEWRVRLAFWGMSDFAEPIRRFEQASGRQFRTLIARTLRPLAGDGRITLAASPAQSAYLIESLLTGTAMQCVISPPKGGPLAARRRLAQQIKQGVLAS